jgi:acyl-coenzyme A thioesterase PaaI-like protein
MVTRARTLEGKGGEAFWEEYASIMGPDGLMTYRYVGGGATALDRHRSEATARLRRDMRGPAGLMAAPLEIMGGDCLSILDDAIAIPAPINCSLDVVDQADGVEEVRVFGDITYEGRTQMFTRFRIEAADQPGRVLALGTNISVVVGPAPEGARYVHPGPGVGDSASLPPFWQAFGAEKRPDGGYQIAELTVRLGSTSGSLHHGPTQVVLEAAATDAALDSAGGDRLQVSHWGVAFVRRGKVGPFVTSARVTSAGPEVILCEAELHDDGVGGRTIAMATAAFRRSPATGA